MHTLSPVNADDSWCGTVQIAKLSDEETSSVAIYDSFCGSWSEGMELKTSFPSAKSWVLIAELKKGVKQERLSLSTPSNGPTSLVSSITGEFSFKHTLPSMQLQPQRFNFQSPTEGLWLEQTLREELSLDWLSKVSSEPSLYFAGKLVGRLANAVVIAYYVLSNHDLSRFASDILSSCLDLLLSDKRPFPLIYDTTIGGIISSAAHVTNDPLSDFGSSFYNDIHFHASYLVYAGAVLLSQQALSSDLKAKLSEIVNSVNSLKDTSQFCAHRAFDWYVGHSWARGLIPNTDGKDEESTSEAAHFYYSASLFAEGIGDTVQSLTARLQLAAMQTSTSHYRLLDDSNTCMPPRWRGNRVDFISQEFESHLRSVLPTNSGWDAMASTSSRKATTRMPSRSKLTANNVAPTSVAPHEFVDKLMDISTCTDSLHKQLMATLQPKSPGRANGSSLAERATLALRCCNACLKSFASLSRSASEGNIKKENLPHLVACARVSLETLRELEDSLPTKGVDICRATLKCVEECNLLGFTKSALLELIALHPFLCRQLCKDAATPIQVPPNKPQGILLHTIPKETLSTELANVQLLYFQLSTRILLSLPNVDLLALSSVLSSRGSLISQLPSLRHSLKMEQYANGTSTLYKLLCRATTDETKPSSSTALIHFKIRSKALMLINHNHNLDLNLWWTQGWKFGLSLLRSAEDALTPYTNEVKPFWSKMVEFAQDRNHSSFIEENGWIEFCEGWMGIAKKLEDLPSLKLLAQLLSNEHQVNTEETDNLATDMSSLNLTGDAESLFAKYNVILLTATANLASKSNMQDLEEKECSKLTHVLDSLKYLNLDDGKLHKTEKIIDGIRRSLYHKLSQFSEINESNAKALNLYDDIALWTEYHLKQSRALSPPILYGTLDSLLQLSQLSLKDSQTSFSYLIRALEFIEPLRSPQANRLLASAFWNWSCVLFQDGKAGTEAQCIPAVERCLHVAEYGIRMCKDSISRQPNEDLVKGDKEILNIMIDQRPRRYELLAICYSKVHDNHSAYDAFSKSIICSLQTTSPPINTETGDLNDSQNFQAIVKKAMQIGLSKLMLKPQEISFNSRAEDENIEKNVKCRLIELQVGQIEERGWSDRDTCSAILFMLLELISPSGYSVEEHPLRRVIVLLRLMEQVVLGPSVFLDDMQIPAPEVIFEEVRSILQGQDYKDDTFKVYTMSFMLSAHMYLAIYYYRSSDTALEGSSSALREARHTKEILKSLLGTGSQRKSSIMRDNNLHSLLPPSQNSKSNDAAPKTRNGSVNQTADTRTTRSRAAASATNQSSKPATARPVRPVAATRRVVKPSTIKNAVTSNKGIKETKVEVSKNNLVYDIERCYNALQMVTEMLGVLGHTFLRLDFLKLLRKLCHSQQRNGNNSSEDYLLASTTLAAEYVKIGKIYRAGSVFAQVATMKEAEVPSDKTSESWIASQMEFKLRYSEYLAITGNVEKSLIAYNDAYALKELYDATVDKEHLKNPLTRTLNFERTAIAATVYASIAYNREDVPTALKCLAQALRLFNNAARQLSKLTPTIDSSSNKDNDDPFSMDVDEKKARQVSSHSNVFENRRCTGLHWRISQSLFDCLLLLSTIYTSRGSSREAGFFLDQAFELTETLASPNFNAKINAAKAELNMSLSNLDEAKKEIDMALLSLGGQDDTESSVLIKKAKGDLLFKLQSNVDASAGYLSACLILERLDKTYSEAETLFTSPKKTVSAKSESNLLTDYDPLLPDIFGHLLRQRIWLLSEDEKNNESQKLLDRLFDFPATSTNKAEENMLLGKMRLREAYNSFQSDLFMSSLSDALISIPCGSTSSNTSNRLTSRQPSIETLADAEKFFTSALDLNIDRAPVKDIRQACLAIALIKSFQTSLGKVSKSNSTLAAAYLDLGSAITLRRELLEVIDNKLATNEARNDMNWPAIDQLSSMRMLTPLNKRSKKLFMPSPSPLGSPMYEKDNLFNEDLKINKYWEGVRMRHVNEFSEPEQGVRDTINKLPRNFTVISISITDDKKTMFVVKYRKNLEPLVVSLPLDNRQNKREGGGEEGAFTYMDAMNELESVIEESDDSIKSASDGNVKSDDEKVAWWNKRKTLDSRMRQLVKNIEFCWLGVFKSLFIKPTATSESALNGLRGCLEKVFKKHIHTSGRKKPVTKVKLDDALLECFSALSTNCKDEELEDLIYFVLDIYLFHGIQLALSEIDIDQATIDIRSALEEYHNKYADNKDEGKVEHTFITLDKLTQSMPWESIPGLRNQSVSRIPSVGFLRDRLDYINFLNQDRLYVNPRNTYCLINPSGDLKRTEKKFGGWFEEMKAFGWKGIVGREPLEVELSNALETSDLFIYFGHGGGQKYIRSQKIRNMPKCASTMLWGCSSGSLKSNGDFDSNGNPNNYLLAGCPCLVANLWDVTDRE
ncbi:hypothetical protein E3P86_01335 [Wallemia ichthyophaga]|uniref:Peptidase C50 domain-containing protein n=1 Tax=Wallemia ichthyophaga TaxID=245174 RepID=A0A4T0J808_WALIC|nr:hypothetical protein E3P86_01335 [Wallemia ichthyophaga]